jgi:hypothetical protein
VQSRVRPGFHMAWEHAARVASDMGSYGMDQSKFFLDYRKKFSKLKVYVLKEVQSNVSSREDCSGPKRGHAGKG